MLINIINDIICIVKLKKGQIIHAFWSLPLSKWENRENRNDSIMKKECKEGEERERTGVSSL